MSDEVENPPPRRRHGRVRRWVIRPFVWGLLFLLVVVVAALLLVQSRYARNRAAGRLVAAVSEKLGRPIRIGDLDYSFLPLAVEVRDVVIPGPKPEDPDFARIPYGRVQFSWRDLEQRVLRLEQLEAVEPEIYIQLNPDGTNNLPRWRREDRQGPRRFEVQIGRILIQGGTVRINERRLPLSVDARTVWGRLIGRAERGGEGGDRLDILATAQDVVTRLPNALPWRGTVSVKGSLDPRQGRAQIAASRIAGPDLQARVEGTVQWRADSRGPRRVNLRVDAKGGAQLANRLGYMKEPIEGPFTFRGRIDVQGRDWKWSGIASAPRIAVLRRVFRDIGAELEGDRETLTADVAGAEYAGGQIEGLVVVDLADEGRPGTPVDLDLALSGLRLQNVIQDQFPGEDFPVVSNLGGTIRGTLRYAFNTEAVLRGSGAADLRVEAVHRQSRLPLTSAARLRIEDGVVSSPEIRVAAPAQEAVARGFELDLENASGGLVWELASRDLGRIAPLLLENAKPGEERPFWLPTAGQGRLAGDVTFDRDRYAVHMNLDLRNAVTPDLQADVVRGSLLLRPEAVEDLQIALTSGPGELTVAGRVPLPREGETVAREPMALVVDARQWPADSVVGFLLPAAEGQELPIQGAVTGRVNVQGYPEDLDGQADFEIPDLVVAGASVGRVRASVLFDGPRIQVTQAVAEAPAGSVLLRGTFVTAPPGQEGGSLDFTIDAPELSLAADPFRQLTGGRLEGRASVAAVVGGTFDRPEVTLRVIGSGLALAGQPLGEDGGSGTAQALVSWDGRSLRATGSLLGLVTFDGGGDLDLQQGADLAFDVRSDDLEVLANLFAPQPLPEFQGSFVGSVAVRADFPAKTWRTELRLADLRAEYQGHRIANLEPVVVDLLPDRLEVRSFYLGEPESETELFVSGSVGLGGEAMPLDLRIQSTISAVWAELFAPDLDIDGYLDVLATVRGTTEDPVLNGQGEVRQGRLIVPDFPQVEAIQGLVYFNRDAIELEGLQARMGGGRLRGSGRLDLPRPGEPLTYRLNVEAMDVSMRYPEGFLARGDANLALVATPQSRVIRGEVRLQRLFYLEDFEVDTLQILRGALQRQRLQVAETDELLATTQLNIQVTGDDALRVNNNLANLRGSLEQFAIRGTLASPVVFGQVEIEPGGKVVYQDNEYEIERGLITFNNPNRLDPTFDIVARTEIRNYDILLYLEGTLERVNARFSSDEGLADLEVLALLATGQELQGEGRLLAPGARRPESETAFGPGTFLAGQAASLVSRRVGTLFGFDRFRIDPLSNTTSGALGGVRLSVGKRISRNLFVTYSVNPSASEEYLVRAEWQISNSVVLVFSRDGKEQSYALDAEWEKRF